MHALSDRNVWNKIVQSILNERAKDNEDFPVTTKVSANIFLSEKTKFYYRLMESFIMNVLAFQDFMVWSIQFLNLATRPKTVYRSAAEHLEDPQLTSPCRTQFPLAP